MTKQKVIPGSPQPQFEVSPQAVTSQLALFSPSFFSSYLLLCIKNPKLTIWQHRVQMLDEQMREFLNNGPIHSNNELIPNYIGVAFLKNAIQSNQVDRVKYLLEILEENLSNEEASQLVKLAIDSDQVAIVDALVESDKIDVNSLRYGDLNESTLHYAISSLHFGVAKSLANNPKIDIDATMRGNITALHWIIEVVDQNKVQDLQDVMDIVNIIVSYKTQVIAKKYGGDTPLHCAIQSNNLPIFEVLLQDPDIEINALGTQWNRTPMHYAVLGNRVQMVKRLIEQYEHKLDINAQDFFGCTPLHYVQSAEVMKLLLDQGADIHIPGNEELSFYKRCNSDSKAEEPQQLFQKEAQWFLEYQQSYYADIKQPDTVTPPDTHLAGESKQEEVQESAE